MAWFEKLGGRATVMVLLVLVVLCVNDFVAHGQLQEGTISNLLVLAGIGVGGRTIEDVGKAFASRGAPKPKK